MRRRIRDTAASVAAALSPSLWHRPTRLVFRGFGQVRPTTWRSWWPFAGMPSVAVALLGLGRIALDLLRDLLEAAALAEKEKPFADRAPDIRDWLSLQNAVRLLAVLCCLRSLTRRRRRVVVEGFVDYTKAEAQAGSGLATLLIAEFGRRRDLYRDANAEMSIPAKVGVEPEGGSNRVTAAGSFLGVDADDRTPFLEGAVASDGKVELGPAMLQSDRFWPCSIGSSAVREWWERSSERA